MNIYFQKIMHASTLLICSILFTTHPAAAEICHIHAPDDYPAFSKRPLVIPAVGDRSACETLNRQRFAKRGRCHCNQSGIGNKYSLPDNRLKESAINVENLP